MSLLQGMWSLGEDVRQVTRGSNLVWKMITRWEGVKYDHCVSHRYPRSLMKGSFCPFGFSLVHRPHGSGGLTPPAGRKHCCLWSLWITEHQHPRWLEDPQGTRPGRTGTGSLRQTTALAGSEDDFYLFSHQGRAKGWGGGGGGGYNPAGGIWVR